MNHKIAEETALDEGAARWLVQACARLLATFALLQGVFIIIGGAVRWSSPSFQVALALPGAPASWGFLLGALGLVALAGSLYAIRRAVVVGLYGAGVWCGFFAIGFVIAAMREPTASTTGVFAYFFLAILSFLLAAAYRKPKRR